MATFQALGFNLAVGCGIIGASLAAFSTAVRFEYNALLAPRTWARPTDVIKNVLKSNYGLRWIPWALSLSYKQMLIGIPGTGTRQNGWSGARLKCNLDGIIAIKFHALCFKVAIFATFLCTVIILPLNYSATCDADSLGEDVCQELAELTDFEQTTLAHIPHMSTISSSNGYANETNMEKFKSFAKNQFAYEVGTTPRLVMVVLVAWCIFIYTCVLVWNEWIDNLAMRRAFYLEHNHFETRKDELDYLACLQDPEDPLQEDRPPHVPHPEMRESVPNVSLYSVLYKMPDSLYSTGPDSTPLDQQLEATAEFFDKCVPNQPGFSSSVAAVTILPDPDQVARAWKKWYACATRLRRLRLIRRRMRHLRKKEGIIEDDKCQEEQTPFLGEPDRPADRQRSNSSFSSGGDGFSTQSGETFPPTDHLAVTTDIYTETLPPSALTARHRVDVLATVDEHVGDPSSLSHGHDSTRPSEKTIESQDSGVRLMEGPSGENVEAEQLNMHMDVDVSPTRDNDEESSGGDKRSDEIETDEEDNAASGRSDEEALLQPRMDGSGSAASATKQSLSTTERTSNSDVIRFNSGLYSAGQGSASGSDSQPQWNKQRLHFAKQSRRRRGSSQSIGHAEESKLDLFLSDDGMEQLSVYSREFAQSSAGCCPYGCDYRTIKNADLEELKDMEDEAEELVRKANMDLIEARASVNKLDLDVEEGSSRRSYIAHQISRELSLLNDELSSSDDENEEGKRSGVPDGGIGQAGAGGEGTQDPSLSSEREWDRAAAISSNTRRHAQLQKGRQVETTQCLPSGRWHFSVGKNLGAGLRRRFSQTKQIPKAALKPIQSQAENFVQNVVGQHTYAVVTFTSRQAAIAARQCLADGSGLGRWEEIEDIPVPPLADAPAFNILACRGMCRPVTLTINDTQKRCRNNCTILLLTLFCFLYTIPLSLTSTLLSERLAEWFPQAEKIELISGILTGFLYTGFFSVCPFIFKAFANFGSGASSVQQAEFRALRYYWLFVLVTCFTGSSLATMMIQGLDSGLNLGAEAQEVLRQVAKTIPTQVSATWMNWIIVRFLFTLPVSYLCQANTMIFRSLGMKCCARITRGGGPGGPMPFRIYVDSGVVFFCVVALAPACPLVAPAAMMYFVIISPMLRWLLIFVYRPQYDGGGLRWPLLHDIFLSSMIVAQILLTTMMMLKAAPGPAFLAAMGILPTYLFGQIAKERFLRCYIDAGLVQTSQLDGWDVNGNSSEEDREEFRTWLVDCHKASYVPICLAGLDNFLTSEPAVVVPTDRDTIQTPQFERIPGGRERTSTLGSLSMQSAASHQKGATFRRVSTVSPGVPTERGFFDSRTSAITPPAAPDASGLSFRYASA